MKPGYKTYGFWGAVALMVVSFFTNADVVGDHSLVEKLAATIGALVTAAGYTAIRTFKKKDGETKPAYKTTEFWLSLAAGAIGALYASGAFDAGGPADRIMGIAMGIATMILAGLGYVVATPKKA